MSLMESKSLLLLLLWWISLVTLKYIAILRSAPEFSVPPVELRKANAELQIPSHPPFSRSAPSEHFPYMVNRECNMTSCFRYAPCFRPGTTSLDFKVYVYPDVAPVSSLYSKILSTLRKSPYITDDPTKACVFVPSVDTLDRDALSPGYQAHVNETVSHLPYWRGHGLNHLIFNLYAGTWPDYYEHELGFNVDKAILVKASFSAANMRPGFDISFPLVSAQHPLQHTDMLSTFDVNEKRHILLSFKGKRYVRGIGSLNRNALFHLHNGVDVLMLTTCRHGDDWQVWADDRCAIDMSNYDKFDYESLMRNSTFCLVPRGRRLGSYRFLESLKYGCIPVVVSNEWKLPFSEMIVWTEAIVWADEAALFQVSDMLRDISKHHILNLRRNGRILWDRYFASVDNIVNGVLEIMKARLSLVADILLPHLARQFHQQFPKAAQGVFAQFLCDYPLRHPFCQGFPAEGMSMVLNITDEKNTSSTFIKEHLHVIGLTSLLCTDMALDEIILLHPSACGMKRQDKLSLLTGCISSSVTLRWFCPEISSPYWSFPGKSRLLWFSSAVWWQRPVTHSQVNQAYRLWQDNPQLIVRLTSLMNRNGSKYSQSTNMNTSFKRKSLCSTEVHSFLVHRYFWAMAHNVSLLGQRECWYDMLPHIVASETALTLDNEQPIVHDVHLLTDENE